MYNRNRRYKCKLQATDVNYKLHLNNLHFFNHFINPHSCSLISFYDPSVQIIAYIIFTRHSKSYLDPSPISLIISLSSPFISINVILIIVNNSFSPSIFYNDLNIP